MWSLAATTTGLKLKKREEETEKKCFALMHFNPP
jgi:hypothetical protein